MINLAEHSDMLSLEQRLLSSLRAMEVLMSALSDEIAAVKAAQAETADKLAAAVARADEDRDSFNADLAAQAEKIAELQRLVDEGLATPEDIADLKAIRDKEVEHQEVIDALDVRKPDTLPEA
jgi:septal ring factor EnvC (AmiA/AmiB activator)